MSRHRVRDGVSAAPTETIPAIAIVPGDRIVEYASDLVVTEVDRYRCKNKVHINNRDCYDAREEVKVRR